MQPPAADLPVTLHLGGYTTDQPESSSGLARVELTADGFGRPEPLDGPADPSWLVPGGEHLHAISEDGDQVVSLAADGTVLSSTGSGGMGPAHLSLDPTGRWLAVSNYVSGSVGLVLVEGGRVELTDELGLEGEGPHERQDSSHAHQAVWLDREHLLVCDLGADRVHEVTAHEGELLHTGEIVLPAGTGPRHLALHPTRDDLAWVVGELDRTVHVLQRDRGDEGDDGVWRAGASVSTTPDGPAEGETTAAGIAVAPDGGTIYVSTRGTDTVSVISTADDRLELVQQVDVTAWPRFIGWVPGHEGRLLLVAGERADRVDAWRVAPDGRLDEVVASLHWSAPTWVG